MIDRYSTLAEIFDLQKEKNIQGFSFIIFPSVLGPFIFMEPFREWPVLGLSILMDFRVPPSTQSPGQEPVVRTWDWLPKRCLPSRRSEEQWAMKCSVGN